MSVDACPVARTRSDVTPEWLSGLFGCPITSVGLHPVGTGQMGSLLRAELSFSDGHSDHIPTSLIIKLAAASDDVRAACTSMGLYEAEVRFFQELAPLFGRSVPQCYLAALDSQAGWFTLVLEDLADRAVPAFQAPGTRVDKAAAALRELSALQALMWDDHDVAQLPWLNRSRGERFFRTAAASCEPFLNRFGAQLNDRHVALFERVLPSAVDWAGSWQGPITISHGDFRLDNLMMAADEAPTRVIIVDWQTAKVGPPLLDVTYYLGGCLSERERAAHERDLLADYCRSLEAAGVDGYSFAQCWEDYRRCSVYGLFMTAFGVQATPTPRGDAMIVASARHCADFVLSLEAEELIP
jgi:aminoglycoside/choline kinase family phosphotransferase